MNEIKWYGRQQRDNRIWLKRFIKHFGLTRPQVAEHAGVSLTTVDRWLAPEDAKSHRKMPATARKLLTLLVDTKRIKKG